MLHHYLEPESRLIQAINRSNPTLPVELTIDMVEFVNAETYAGIGTNARVLVRARGGVLDRQYFTGEFYLHYNRINIVNVLANIQIPGTYNDYLNSREVVEALRDRYGFPLKGEDVSNILASNPNEILIATQVNSLGYYGSLYMTYSG